MCLPSPNLIVLFFFYSLQGVPYGLQSRFLPLILRSHGSSLTSLGLYKLLYLPWVFKSTYAPFVDSCSTKRRWLQLAIGGLFMCSAALSTTSISSLSHGLFLPICLLTFNFASATLDIAVDSLAITMLSKSQLSQGNTAQVVGYKFGAVLGGGVFTWLSSSFDLSFLFASLCGVYMMGFTVATFYEGFDRHDFHNFVSSGDTKIEMNNKSQDDGKNYFSVIKSSIFDSPSTPPLVGLLIVYKLGEQGAMNMLPLMLLDSGMSVITVGFWTGVVGQIVSITGSSFTGFIVPYFGNTVSTLQVLFYYRLFAITLITIFSFCIDLVNPFLGIALMNLTLLVSGIITTTVFTLMMECTQKEVPLNAQATHYTVLSTAEILGKLVFATLASSLTDLVGYPAAYLVFLSLSVVPIYILNSRIKIFVY